MDENINIEHIEHIEHKEPKIFPVLKALLVPLAGFFIWYLINFVVQFGFSFVASIVISAKNPNATLEVLEIKLNNFIYENISLMFIVTAALFVLIYFIVQKITKFSKHIDFEYKKTTMQIVVCSFLLGTFVGVFANTGLEIMSKYLPESWVQGNRDNIEVFQHGNVFIMLIAVVIFAPIVEELIFRGLIYNALKKIFNTLPNISTKKTQKMSMFASAFISSILFGIYHGNILQGMYTALLSLFMVWIYEKSGSIISAMLVHSAFNFAGIPTFFFIQNFGKILSIIICIILSLLVIGIVCQATKAKKGDIC